MITLIICTYNREKYIRPLLESIAKNDYPATDYEIVLVDNKFLYKIRMRWATVGLWMR